MRQLVVVAAVTVSALTMAACGSGNKKSNASSATTAPSPTVTANTAPSSSVPAVTIAPTTSVVPGADGKGIVTVALTDPVPVTSTVHTQVACDNESGHYLAQASFPGQDAGNDTISFSVNVAGYGGPRHYRASVTVEILGPTGDSTKTTVAQDVAVNSAADGSFSVATKADNGRQITGSFGWTCS